MQTFKTLLLREWMQHQRGWWLLGGVPLILMLVGLTFGTVSLDGDEPPIGLLLIMGFGYAMGVVALAGLAVAIQAPGLARRDQQDRSIEFWLSLPVGHWTATGATLLSHLWLFPLMALGLGLLGSVLVAPFFVARGFGVAALLDLPWGHVALVYAAGALRQIVGLVVAMGWAAPVLLLTMAASAWLKRWGLPVVAAVLGPGSALLKHAYGLPQPQDLLAALWERFTQALVPGLSEVTKLQAELVVKGDLAQLPSWLMDDLGHVLAQLASPLFVGAVAFSVGCVWLMVLRRQRG